MTDMADGIVLELGYTAREVDLLSRVLERLANEHADEMAFETLVNMREVVSEHMPLYVLASLARMRTARTA